MAPETPPGLTGLVLLAVQGVEYRAVRRGVTSPWSVLPVPLGVADLAAWWEIYQPRLAGRPAVLLGLAGGLQPEWGVGSGVIYRGCTAGDTGATSQCDPEVTQWLTQRLGLPLVQGLTLPQVVTQPRDKQALGKRFGCAVVDMESYGLLAYLPRLGVVRVVSDTWDQALPDLNRAILPERGQLHPLRLGQVLLQQPLVSWRLIHHSAQALHRLTTIARRLTSNAEKNYNKTGTTPVSEIQT